MRFLQRLARSIRLRNLLFLLLLVAGIIPLLIGTLLLTRQNAEILQTQEQAFLTRSARDLSEDLNAYVESVTRQLRQLGEGALLLGDDDVAPIRRSGLEAYLSRFVRSNAERVLSLQLLDERGIGPAVGLGQVGAEIDSELRAAHAEARASGKPVYRFARRAVDNKALAVIAVPVVGPQGERIVAEATVDLRILERIFGREAQGEVSVFLIDSDGRVLWAEGADERTVRALAASSLVRDFRLKPLNLTAEYELDVHGERQRIVGRVSPVEQTGWGVVVQKPLAAAYAAAEQVVSTAIIALGVFVVLALLLAMAVARVMSDPIQVFADTTHGIAAGNFGQRVEVVGPGREIAELAADFNRMSDHVENYVEKLREAAERNRELFISTIRAFAAAVDAKDPYTRGHSQRVADFSRTIARYLGRDEEFQEQVWIAGVLHDVGKIGVEDRILNKGGVLSSEEYEQMKRHTIIGAEILSPIQQLQEVIPAVRWHHEAWNGRGYPDGLAGEEIPLSARIVCVADSFDAMTTNRPYQRASSAEFTLDTIEKLTGSRFDAKIVTAFLRACEEGEIVPEEPAPVVDVGAVGE